MPLILTISDETLLQSFNKAILSSVNYNSFIKRTLDNILDNEEIKAQIEAYIKEHMQRVMASPQFTLAMADEMAKLEVDKLKK